MVQEHYQLSQKQFAAELSVAEATISSVYRGRTAPTNNLISAIHSAYPAINVNWLMFGEGEMLLPLSADTTEGGADVRSPENSGSPAAEGAIGQNVGFGVYDGPSLFDAPPVVPPSSDANKGPQNGNNSVSPGDMKVLEALSRIKIANEVDKPERRIKEIRVFFDDGTFEAFVPVGK